MTERMRMVVAGGTGALGRVLTAELAEDGHEVVVLSRAPAADPRPGIRQVRWDARTVGSWAEELTGSSLPLCVVNLAGQLVDCRPTAANIARLRDSRVDATAALVAASQDCATPVRHWLQSSTTAIWSDAGEQRITEHTPLPDPGLPQMTGVARPWEEAAAGARTEHLMLMRSAIVLAQGTPFWERLTRLVRLGLGGAMDSGRQWFSWIHVDDWVAIARAGLGLEPMQLPCGPLVAAGPHPVRNAELMRTLRGGLGRSFGLPAPGPLVRLGALALGSDPALALTGRHCTSSVLADLGWTFRFATLTDAVADLCGRDPSVSG